VRKSCIPESEYPKIGELYQSRKSISEISKIYGVCNETIRKVLKRLEIKRTWAGTGKKPKIPKTEHPKIAETYLSGVSAIQISQDYGVSAQSIRTIISRMGVKKASAIPETESSKVIELYKSGQSLSEISEIYDVSSPTVKAVLLKAGVTLRKPGTPRRKLVQV
jgi:hypothetical protein